jgi:DNA-binding XRE family transcriptional regulator
MILDRTKPHRVELDCKAVGRSIAAARRSRGWTQKELAEAGGFSWHTVVGWENGLRLPQTRYLAVQRKVTIQTRADSIEVDAAL